MSVIIGLTGQSGSGKTTVSKVFRENGFAIVNCDKVSRKVNESGSECNKKLAEIFPDCFDDNFTLDRRKLGDIVFADKNKLDILNKTVYPYIFNEIKLALKNLSYNFDFIVLDAPTLFEFGIDKMCQVIVSVLADENLRLERIMKRDKISEMSVRNRFKSQKNDEFFKVNSDFIIFNNSDLRTFEEQVRLTIKSIKEQFNGN